MRILTVFGTRPEAINMAPLVKALQKIEGIEAKVCVTDQHRQMLDQVASLFDITPDLDLMRPGQRLTELTSRPEALAAGTIRFVGTDADMIVSQAQRLLDDPSEYLAMSKAKDPYGDGEAAYRIVEIIRRESSCNNS